MAKKKKSIDESWRVILCKMTKDELLYVACNKDDYTPGLYTMVMEVLAEKYGVTKQYVNSVSKIENYFEDEKGTRDLFLDVLEEMGCEKSIEFENDDDEDDGNCWIAFSWQQNYYYAKVINDSAYMFVEDSCGSFCIKDKEEEVRIKEAINYVNEYYPFIMLYYVADESDKSNKWMDVVCRSFFLFTPLFPNLDLYLISRLKSITKGEQLFAKELGDLWANRIPHF